jgi:curved DNA-binding protein CbpA
MSAVRATATGLLQSTPLAHLLVYVLDHRLSGTLVLEDPAGSKHAVWFEDGAPAKVKTADPVVYLGELLVEMGIIDRDTHRQTLARVAQEKRLHGEILVAAGAVDHDTLMLALREQLERKVGWLFDLSVQSAYGFYDQQNLLERWGGLEVPKVSPLALLSRGLRRRAPTDHVDATLARLSAAPLRLHLESRVGLFGLDQHEQAVTDVLRARPHTLTDLVASGVGDESLVRRVVYLLAITRHLDLGGADQRPVGLDAATAGRVSRTTLGGPQAPSVQPRAGVGPGRSAAPAARSTVPAARSTVPAAAAAGPSGPERSNPPSVQSSGARGQVDEMKLRAQGIAGQNYYQILGVTPDASKATIQAAFFQLAKTWHPDRLTGEMADARDIATRAFSRMSEAHQVLCDDERRAQYDALLKEGGGTAEEQEHVARVLRAVSHFQKAEVLFKKGSLEAAEKEAEAAADGDPDQPDYTALLVWIRAQDPQRGEGGQYRKLIKLLDQVLDKHENHERARFYRAQLLKRAGRIERAMKDFMWIVENNPKNLEAARELRLYRMRKGENRSAGRASVSPKGKESLLGKLFKR